MEQTRTNVLLFYLYAISSMTVLPTAVAPALKRAETVGAVDVAAE